MRNFLTSNPSAKRIIIWIIDQRNLEKTTVKYGGDLNN